MKLFLDIFAKNPYAVLFFFLLVGIIISFTILFSSKIPYPNKDERTGKIRFANKTLYDRRNVWLISALSFSLLDGWMILASFLFPLIVIFLQVSLSESSGQTSDFSTAIVMYSVASIFSAFSTYVIKPHKKSITYRKAYCILDFAINTYETQDDIKIKKNSWLQVMREYNVSNICWKKVFISDGNALLTMAINIGEKNLLDSHE